MQFNLIVVISSICNTLLPRGSLSQSLQPLITFFKYSGAGHKIFFTKKKVGIHNKL